MPEENGCFSWPLTSCFGSFGPTATRFLFTLANLVLRHLVDAHPASHSQYRALCYRQISAGIGHAFAKAALMRHLLCLAYPFLLPSIAVIIALLLRPEPAARNCFGPTDPFPLLNFLSSLFPCLLLPPSSFSSHLSHSRSLTLTHSLSERE